jgi:Fe-S-cluster containining protein
MKSYLESGVLPARDRRLIQIVDAALAEATRRSGDWLACRKGCTQCCVGVFAVNQLDAWRLRQGLTELEAKEPARAKRVRARARAAIERLRADFPGDAASGLLHRGEAAERAFAEFGNDEICPALDPESGGCDLYEHRPMTCRVFGPPVESEGGLGVCELCFQGATEGEIAACEMRPDPDDMESKLVTEIESQTRIEGETIVASCLASENG